MLLDTIFEFDDFLYPLYKLNPPFIPHEQNNNGSYIKFFEISDEWSGKDIYLHFEGVSGDMYIWLNGEKVGYSEGSKTPAEFNITPFTKVGINNVSIDLTEIPFDDEKTFKLLSKGYTCGIL